MTNTDRVWKRRDMSYRGKLVLLYIAHRLDNSTLDYVKTDCKEIGLSCGINPNTVEFLCQSLVAARMLRVDEGKYYLTLSF